MIEHRVLVLVLPGVRAMELGMPGQLFTCLRDNRYTVVLCAERPGPVWTACGFTVQVEHGLSALAEADTIVVPGYAPHDQEQSPEVLAALRQAHGRGARVVSICTGAFTLAAAGLLDGLRATTHWTLTGDLARWHPAVQVEQDVLYVDQGQVMTSAGVASGIDLCLHLIRQDHGVAVANQVSRIAVAAPHREGGQAQYVARPVPQEQGSNFTATLDWARANLAEQLTVRQLARHAGMSERTLARRFVAELGITPLRWLTATRVALAREILERQDCGVEELAERVGMGTATNLRNHFRRLVGTTPSAYRRTFLQRGGQAPDRIGAGIDSEKPVLV
ncbi:GlxA family transcriptional regulator [Kutzneria albida]|uniref:HTH araC/xylS-type domain-containing protein n=1 Tax=Kutzneria albida DSM 43870 TaxID=1449976 RepID=W5WA99_9PSEU|nr:DJ-1/PfpI family protein [Kutzneria albida]AHH97862.1 hypothetical protein KALB_4500 [Kutzneria albida DSM 43870]